ncbi:hypothetical protein [Halomonas sp. N3-2A]|uniref:hypothetical protein n=1 Tax=Halomonas sp. N3-2A TaxID=2014541 RepID=UPI0012FD11F7|nr:hypothetical protein [Halomonas sp. N3-2A]
MAECKECGIPLMPDEEYYLEDRCECCERMWHERISDWREGHHDPGLDAGEFEAMPRIH